MNEVSRRGKRVLVLSYYFPPLGLSGVQRISKFVKYLTDYGWHSHVITSRPYSYFAFDDSLVRDIPQDTIVTRTRSIDPTRWRLGPGTVSIPSSKRHGTMRSISNRLFIPDNKRLWLPFARHAARKVLKAAKFDVIFSTAPPYSSHLLAVELGEEFDVPVVIDFRDNWVGNPRTVFASEKQRVKHQQLEFLTLSRSQHVVTINNQIADDLISRSGLSRNRFTVIEQGYDSVDLAEEVESADSTDVTFVYAGIFYDAQKPDTFLHGLARARAANKSVRFHARAVFVGLVPDYFSDLVARLDLEDAVRHTGYLEHDRALGELLRADIPWLTIGHQRGEEQISTGKLAEYIGTRKPILGLVPRGAARELLEEYEDSVVVDPDDREATSEAIIDLTERFLNKETPRRANEQVVKRLDRRRLAGELARVFDEACKI